MFKVDKEMFKQDVVDYLRNFYRKNINDADEHQIFNAVAYALKEIIVEDWMATHQAFDEQDAKMVYYMSMEFLMGRALGNNIINLKATKEIREALNEMGLNLENIEDAERADAIFTKLMGQEVDLRKNFIQSRASTVNMDDLDF